MPEVGAEQRKKILEVIARRAGEAARRNKIASYFPDEGEFRRALYAKHVEFFAAGKVYKERLFMAGNRLGKSEAGAYESVCHATGIYPAWWTGRKFNRPTEGWACGTTGETTRDIVQNKLLGPVGEQGTGMIPAHLIVKTTSRRGGIADALESIVVRHVSGKNSLIGLKSYQQGRESFEGTAKDWIWCIARGEMVQMADGRMLPIEDVRAGDVVLSLDSDGRPVTRKVLGSVSRGNKPCIRVMPKHGTPVICTPDHEIFRGYSRNNKRTAEEVKEVAQPQPGWWPTVSVDRAEAWYAWSALVISEGTIKSRKVTNGSVDAMEKAIALLPSGARVRRKNFSNSHVPDWHLYWEEFWAELEPALSHEKKIPDWIFQSSPENVKVFLRWLYMGDGWASGHSIGYATTSYVLAQQIVVLLNRLGIRASFFIKKSTHDKWREQYWVLIARSTEVLAFAEIVGIMDKQAALDKVSTEAERREASKKAKCSFPTNGRNEFRARNRWARLKASKIRCKESVGEREVFDITVENEHRFLCGTSLVSNCDEEPPQDIYTECLYRTVTTRGILYTTFTPLQGMSDVVKSFVEPETDESADFKFYVQAGWDDVPHIHEDEKKALIATTPPYQIEARTKGIPALGAGAIYPIAESDITVPTSIVPASWPRAFGMDVGWSRTAVLWGAKDPATGKVVIYDEYYQGMGEPPTHAMGIKARGAWIPGVIDPASNGRSQVDGSQLLQLYRKLGLQLTPAENSVEAGIQAVWTMLVSGQLKVQAHCFNFFREFRQYHRDDKGKGKIVKKHDHAVDSLRYLIISGLQVMKLKPIEQPRHMEYPKDLGDRGWMI